MAENFVTQLVTDDEMAQTVESILALSKKKLKTQAHKCPKIPYELEVLRFAQYSLTERRRAQVMFHHFNLDVSIFHTHFNGDRPYKVILEAKGNEYGKGDLVRVYPRTLMNSKCVIIDFATQPVYLSPVNRVWFTEVRDIDPENWDECCLLLEVSECKYVFIGKSIISFSTKTPILNFKSPHGGSDVPYPFAITEEEVILLDEQVILPLQVSEEVCKQVDTKRARQYPNGIEDYTQTEYHDSPHEAYYTDREIGRALEVKEIHVVAEL